MRDEAMRKTFDTGANKPKVGTHWKYLLSLIGSRERSGSRESLSSVGSVTSSVSRSWLGVTSLAGQSSKSPAETGGNSTTTALQKAVKEKEQHIEQLLVERDLERSEVAKSAVKLEEVENQLALLKC